MTVLGRRLAEAGLDGLVVTSYTGSYYLSGAPIHAFGRPVATIVTAGGDAAMVIASIEDIAARAWIVDPAPVSRRRARKLRRGGRFPARD